MPESLPQPPKPLNYEDRTVFINPFKATGLVFDQLAQVSAAVHKREHIGDASDGKMVKFQPGVRISLSELGEVAFEPREFEIGNFKDKRWSTIPEGTPADFYEVRGRLYDAAGQPLCLDGDKPVGGSQSVYGENYYSVVVPNGEHPVAVIQSGIPHWYDGINKPLSLGEWHGSNKHTLSQGGLTAFLADMAGAADHVMAGR